MRPTRRRGGSSARRAAAGRARRAAAGRARRAGARRRRASRRRDRRRAAAARPSRGRASRRATRRRAGRSAPAPSPAAEQRVEVGVGLGELRADLGEAVEQVARLAHAVLDVAAHVLGGIELRLLLEQADVAPGSGVAVAARGVLDPGHDPQQRRLAGAVRAEHADLRARQERQRDVREHLPVGAVELVDPVHAEDVVAHGRPRYYAAARSAAGKRCGVGPQKMHRIGGSFVRPPDQPALARQPLGRPSTSGAPCSVHSAT